MRKPKRLRFKKLADRALLALCVFLLVSPAISVFLWMLSLAFKNEVDNLAYPPVFVPNPPHAEQL